MIGLSFAARMAGLRTILWGIRTTDITKGGSRVTRGIRWLCARLSRRVPVRIVCAAEASLRIHAGVGYDRKRLMVIPNGLDIERMEADAATVADLRAIHGIPARVPVVGMVGRFNAIKGQDDFVRAAGRIAVKHPDCRFMMVGLGCDRNNAQLAEWITQTGAPERFVLLGKRADVPVCLAAMDVFALPSRTEGFPNVLAEAMAMARPCVTMDVGDAKQVIAECGLVVPPEDPAAMADAILHLLDSDTETRASYGQCARQRVEVEFTMARCSQRFVALYDSVSGLKKDTE